MDTCSNNMTCIFCGDVANKVAYSFSCCRSMDCTIEARTHFEYLIKSMATAALDNSRKL